MSFVELGLEAKQVLSYLLFIDIIGFDENTETELHHLELRQLRQRHPWLELELTTPGPLDNLLGENKGVPPVCVSKPAAY